MLDSLFGAPEIDIHTITNLEKGIPNIILWAVPVMLFFTVIEMIVTYYQEKDYYEKKETIGSILVGIGSLIVSAALKASLLYLFIWLYNLLPWRMALSWWTLLPCYVIYDFFSYLAHRVSHEQRFWWATHVVHHTGEHYNLTVSYRLSWVQHFKLIFFIPVALIGFHPIIFFVTNQIAVLFQFWVHTEYIRRMPAWIEYIFATPSNHRVHHGSQEKYIDKNFGATFIFWDRLFGTFQPEEEQVIYGITTNIENKANPLLINFQEFIDIVNDVRSAKGLRRKLYFIFGSPIAIAEEKKRLENQVQLTDRKRMDYQPDSTASVPINIGLQTEK
ncbi:sterol desaturase family protein [Spirosoma sp. BT702]|uniref:Sterol desaturase family protein n=1 Tax=Spirosoma profusum TaxID=2771354 RepID=A0A927AST5_9BACT|nr:sterol desaturase family protein [Spirosoma profusum]MBD2704383.1 sterol desaturase family protein [Spirosoma profusum]